VTGNGSVGGTGISCTASGGDCSQTFSSGETVVLTASPVGGATFTGFGGDPCEAQTATTCDQSMGVSQTVSAEFAGGPTPPPPPPLTTTPVVTTPTTTPPATRKCPKGKKLKKGKCVKKKGKKKK
jgi:hypothetical protein